MYYSTSCKKELPTSVCNIRNPLILPRLVEEAGNTFDSGPCGHFLTSRGNTALPIHHRGCRFRYMPGAVVEARDGEGGGAAGTRHETHGREYCRQRREMNQDLQSILRR